MGNILKLTTGYFASTTRFVDTQTDSVLTRSIDSQTNTKLTEKLTHFNNIAVSSAEVFDKICDICNLDKEAVGYCWNCEQYLCLRCCSHHEKISLSREHRLIGKSDFFEVGVKKSLFEQSFIPVTQASLPTCLINSTVQCYSYFCSHSTYVEAIFHSQIIKATCFLLSSSTYCPYELVSINEKGKYRQINRFLNSEKAKSKILDPISYFPRGKMVHGVLSSLEGICQMFEVGGKCTSVIPFNDGLAVLVGIPTGYSLPEWQIQFLDMKGNVKKRICYDAGGQTMLKTPEYMTCNATSDILYVSDRTENCVIAIDRTGNIVYKFTHADLQSPKAVACDNEGNIYVACKNKVVQIDSHGKECRVLVETSSKDITGIYYNITAQHLVVIDSVKKVTIFSVK